MSFRIALKISCEHAPDAQPCAGGFYGGRPDALVCTRCPHRVATEPGPAVDWIEVENVCLGQRMTYTAAAWMDLEDAKIRVLPSGGMIVPVAAYEAAQAHRVEPEEELSVA